MVEFIGSPLDIVSQVSLDKMQKEDNKTGKIRQSCRKNASHTEGMGDWKDYP